MSDPQSQGLDLRSVQAAQKALEAAASKKKLLNRVHELMRSIFVIFNELQKKLPEGSTELEFHEDRIVFQLGGIPLTAIYLKEEKPMYVDINKKSYLAERVFLCNANFGNSGGEDLGPREMEIGSIFVCDEVYVVRWMEMVEVWNTPTELMDAILNAYYAVQPKHTDRDGNEIAIATDAWLYGQPKSEASSLITDEVYVAPVARPNPSAAYQYQRRP
jgi:hypothetical protein